MFVDTLFVVDQNIFLDSGHPILSRLKHICGHTIPSRLNIFLDTELILEKLKHKPFCWHPVVLQSQTLANKIRVKITGLIIKTEVLGINLDG